MEMDKQIGACWKITQKTLYLCKMDGQEIKSRLGVIWELFDDILGGQQWAFDGVQSHTCGLKIQCILVHELWFRKWVYSQGESLPSKNGNIMGMSVNK